MSATAASRSTSLTRSSPTSEKTVVPSATAAATARAGTSSSEGISLAGTSVRAQGAGQRPDGRRAGVAGDEGDVDAPMRCRTRDVAEPGRSAVDAGHVDRAARHDAPGHHEEGRRGGVAGHGALDRLEGRRADPHDATLAPGLDRQVGARLGQHLLGVGAGGHRLAHDRRAARPRARRGGWPTSPGRWPPWRSSRCRAARRPGRAAAAGSARPGRATVGAHEPERLGHPVHGPGRERLVADQLGLPVEPGHQAGQEAHGGPRVPAVEGRGGRCRRARPPCTTTVPSSWRSTPAPMASTAASEAATSAPSESPWMTDVPSASAPSSTARCEIDFSPGRADGAAARHAAVDDEDARAPSRQLLGPAAVARAASTALGQGVGVGAVDHQDEHAARSLRPSARSRCRRCRCPHRRPAR